MSYSKKRPKESGSFLSDGKPLTEAELIKPPNWTVRKQSLMERFKSNQTPNCTANIDFYIDELAKEYKASREKVGKRSLLM